MPAELCLDRLADLAVLEGESRLLERRHHLAGAEEAEIAATLRGLWLGRDFAGDGIEVLATGRHTLAYAPRLIFGGDKDMGGMDLLAEGFLLHKVVDGRLFLQIAA